MAELTVKFHGYGYSNTGNRTLFVTIDGRQALKEGPRKVGHCNRCNGQCMGVTADCELRVWQESTTPLKDIHQRKF